MNTVNEQTPVFRSQSRIAPITDDSALSNQRVQVGEATRKAISRVGATDCRIASLRTLALTLLREIESLERSNGDDTSELDLHAEVRHFETELIRNALVSTGGRQRRAARLLGMKVPTLNAKIKRYGIVLTD